MMLPRLRLPSRGGDTVTRSGAQTERKVNFRFSDILPELGGYSTSRASLRSYRRNNQIALERADAVLKEASSLDLYQMHVRAVSWHRQGHFSRAQALYERVLDLGPYRKLLFSALNNLALLFQDTGDLRKAEETYIKALKLSACGSEQSFCANCHALQVRGPLQSEFEEDWFACSNCGTKTEGQHLVSCAACSQHVCGSCRESWRTDGVARDAASLRNYAQFLHLKMHRFAEAEDLLRLAIVAGKAWEGGMGVAEEDDEEEEEVRMVEGESCSRRGRWGGGTVREWEWECGGQADAEAVNQLLKDRWQIGDPTRRRDAETLEIYGALILDSLVPLTGRPEVFLKSPVTI